MAESYYSNQDLSDVLKLLADLEEYCCNDADAVSINSSLDPCTAVKAKSLKKHRKMRRYKTVKTDIRDSFAAMYTNSMNSSDFKVMLGYFSTFYRPDAVCHIRRKLPHKNVLTSITGPQMFANAMFSNVAIFPDSVSSLTHSKFHKASVNGSVTFSIEINVTKMYNLPSIHEVLPGMVMDEVKTGNNDTSEDVERAMEKVKISLPQRKNPVRCRINLSIILLTDPITKMCTRCSTDIRDIVNDFSVEAES